MMLFWFFLAAISALKLSNATYEQFIQWQTDYNIHYNSSELAARFGVWKSQAAKIGLNPYTDRTERELAEFFALNEKGFHAMRKQIGDVPARKWEIFPDDMVQTALQNGRDWRAAGYTTVAKNQGQQPYCGTFSRVGAAESTYGIGGGYRSTRSPKPMISFSVEEVVDCCGWAKNQDDVFFQKGFNSWSSYPFDTSNHGPDDTQPCYYNPGTVIPGSVMDGWTHQSCSGKSSKWCEDQMATFIYYNGPVQGGITAEVFYNADASHFVTPAGCNVLNFDHGVTYVGFGTDPYKGDYWLIKNSWGDNWEDQGYIKVARGVNCGGLAGSAMAYLVGDEDAYFPGSSKYLGIGFCNQGSYQIVNSANSVDEARARANMYPSCKVFFYSVYSSSWGVYCNNNQNCARDNNENWGAYLK